MKPVAVSRFSWDPLGRPPALQILGGSKAMSDPLLKAMLESPLLQDIVAEARRAGRMEVILTVLEGRFGPLTPAVTGGLERVKDRALLVRLTPHAAVCRSLRAFEGCLRRELSRWAPASTRDKCRACRPPG
jgi:hypothetical protein